MREPEIHSNITDVLDPKNTFAHKDVACKICTKLVHSGINECMTTWIETGNGNYCFKCFSIERLGVDEFSEYHRILDSVYGLSERRHDL